MITALGVGDTARKAGKAAREAEEIKKLQAKSNAIVQHGIEEAGRQHEEIVELQKEQIKVTAMNDAQKMEYQKQKAIEEELQRKTDAMLTLNYTFNEPAARKAVEISINKGKFSAAMLQTYLGKSFAYVATLANNLEQAGIIGPQINNKPRDMLVFSMDEYDLKIEEYIKEQISNN